MNAECPLESNVLQLSNYRRHDMTVNDLQLMTLRVLWTHHSSCVPALHQSTMSLNIRYSHKNKSVYEFLSDDNYAHAGYATVFETLDLEK